MFAGVYENRLSFECANFITIEVESFGLLGAHIQNALSSSQSQSNRYTAVLFIASGTKHHHDRTTSSIVYMSERAAVRSPLTTMTEQTEQIMIITRTTIISRYDI